MLLKEKKLEEKMCHHELGPGPSFHMHELYPYPTTTAHMHIHKLLDFDIC